MAEQIAVAPPLPPGSVDLSELHKMITAKKPATEEEVKAYLDTVMPKPEAAAPVAEDVAAAPDSETAAASAPASQEV